MPKQFTEAQLKQFREVFNIYDIKGNGCIQVGDIGNVVRSLGYNPTQSDVKAWMDELEHDNECNIDFKDFLKIMQHEMRDFDGEEKLRQAFKMFDRTGDGYLNCCELHHIMTNLGERMTECEFEQLLNEAEINRNEMINIDEFIKIILYKKVNEPVSIQPRKPKRRGYCSEPEPEPKKSASDDD